MSDDLNPKNTPKGTNAKVLNRDVYFKDTMVITQGDQGNRAYYIEKGRVEILVKDDNHQLKVAELGPGDIFGEMSLINHEPRSASVRTIEDCTLSVISRDEIEGRIKRIEDRAIRALINVLTDRLRNATKGQLEHYKSLSDFQDRVTGVVDRVHLGIDHTKRDQFREDIEPVLEKLQSIMDRYQA